MNFLNTDFGSAIEPTTKGSTSAEDFREFYLTYRSQSQPRAQQAFSPAWNTSSTSNFAANTGFDNYTTHPGADSNNLQAGKAGPAGTLLWNTLTLAERSVKNYTRNLLAYGVRAGMYGGVSGIDYIALDGSNVRSRRRDGLHVSVSRMFDAESPGHDAFSK
jgi:hypothetical protein